MALRTALAESHPVQVVFSKDSIGLGALPLASVWGNEMFRQVNLARPVATKNKPETVFGFALALSM